MISIFKKDDTSKYEFLSYKDFFLALLLMFFTLCFVILIIPFCVKFAFPEYAHITDSNYIGLVLLIISLLLSIQIMYLFSCVWKNKTLKEGLFFLPTSKDVYVKSILIGILMPILTSPFLFLAAPKNYYAKEMVSESGGIVFIFIAAMISPIFEEFFYRGFFFSFIQSKFNSFWAIVTTALFFGISHILNIGNAYIILSLFIFYGFVLTFIRYYTRSIIPSIITHLMHNFTLLNGFIILSYLGFLG